MRTRMYRCEISKKRWPVYSRLVADNLPMGISNSLRNVATIPTQLIIIQYKLGTYTFSQFEF